MAPNIVFVPNIRRTQNTEHRHRTQDTNTAHNRPPLSNIHKRFENILF